MIEYLSGQAAIYNVLVVFYFTCVLGWTAYMVRNFIRCLGRARQARTLREENFEFWIAQCKQAIREAKEAESEYEEDRARERAELAYRRVLEFH